MTAQMGIASAGKVFFDDAAIHYPLNVVGAMVDFSGLLAGPGQVPFADPEIKLFLF
jgi:hypothetical protein